jgi:Protein of unknown function (DUF3073)
MGRGRAKAKQTKVARQLKYNSGETNFDRLRAELGVGDSQVDGTDDHDSEDPYAAYADYEEEDDEEDALSSPHHRTS